MILCLLACDIDNRVQTPGREPVSTDSGEPTVEGGVNVVEVSATERGDCLGQLARAGDMNGDGKDDLLVSVPHSDDGGQDAGKILALAGPLDSGESALEAPIFFVAGHHELMGDMLTDQRDLDGDGVVDLFFIDGGDAYAIPGPVTGEMYVRDLDPLILQDGERTLRSTALGSLLSGDTVDAAVFFAGTNEVGIFGGVGSFDGRTAATPDVIIDGGGDILSRRFSSADVTGDGIDDLLLPGDRMWLLPGPLSGAGGDVVDVGIALYEGWTDLISGAGDVNGDGTEDVFSVAAAGGAGSVRLFDGYTLENTGTWAGENPEDRLGAVGSALGDIDGDGKGDLVIGGPENDASQDRGRVWVLLDAGALGEHEIGGAQIVLDGVSSYDGFGYAAVGPGDILGGERPDFAVTAWGFDGGSGRLYVYSLP